MIKISHKADYAMRAVLDLALHAPPNSGVRSADVAHRTGAPEKFLEAILLDLRKSGFISSKRGPDGGHWLARDPARVTAGALLEAIDGPLLTSTRSPRRASTPADICVQALWDRVAASVRAVVDAVTIDDLRRQANPGVGEDFVI
jgi:Rrf2 family protein